MTFESELYGHRRSDSAGQHWVNWFPSSIVAVLIDWLSRPVIQSGFRSTSSAYPLIHIDAYNNALSKVTRPDDVDPVIYVPAYNIEESPSACCHVQCADMRFLCPISGNGTSLAGRY